MGLECEVKKNVSAHDLRPDIALHKGAHRCQEPSPQLRKLAFQKARRTLLLFGGRKIPELMRGLGSGIKEFKDASKEPSEEEDTKIEP